MYTWSKIKSQDGNRVRQAQNLGGAKKFNNKKIISLQYLKFKSNAKNLSKSLLVFCFVLFFFFIKQSPNSPVPFILSSSLEELPYQD